MPANASPEPPAAAPPPRPRAAVWTGTTYFAEGLPWSVLHQIAAEFFTAIGLPARQVGYTSALHLTNTLKFVWSPLVDLFGSLRGWMIATQALLGVAIGGLALAADHLAGGGGSSSLVWFVLVVIGILSATHDIACDGYYMDALDPAAQARFSGVRVAAFRLAMLVGSSALVYLGGRVSWLLAFGAAALIFAGLTLFHRFFLPRGAGEARVRPRGDDDRLRHVLAAYASFLGQPRARYVLAFLITYKLGDALMFGMSKVLLRDLGVITEVRGVLNGFGTAAAIGGAIVAGAWISRVSLRRALVPITIAMAATEPLYLILAGYVAPIKVAAGLGAPAALAGLHGPPLALVGGILMIEQFAGGLATAAQMVFIMRHCHPDHKAAHFAFATALYSLAQTASGTYSGVVYEGWGPIGYFGVTSLICVPCLLLLPRVLPREG
ncbi:MAG: MFS transporter [Nannocystaceae bacterium]